MALSSSLISSLRSICGPDGVLSDPDELVVYECDAYTLARAVPELVMFPTCTSMASEAMRLLARHEVPFVPRGAGTSLAGGCLAAPGSVCLSTARMNRILEVDAENACAVVEAGVVTEQISRAAKTHGYHYAPDPSSQAVCTIGGNVANNAGGPHTLKYGVTAQHVLGLTVVLADGSVLLLGGRTRVTHGYDLKSVFVGSEGTMGLITEVIVRLSRRPPAVRTVLAVYDSLERAARTVGAIAGRGIIPAALELMDRATLEVVELAHGYGFPADAEALLIIELDGCQPAVQWELQEVLQVCQLQGAVRLEHADSVEGRERLWKARKTAFGALGRAAPCCLTADGVVPRSRLPEILVFIKQVGCRYGLRIANLAHAGDGNVHPNFLFDDQDRQQVQKVLAASHEILAECVRLGGSVTGEHGIGIEKIGDLKLMFGPSDLRAQRTLREVFDPRHRANPNKVFED